MKSLRPALIAAAVIAVALPIVLAQERAPAKIETYKLDPVHTCVWFKIKHLKIANFYGRFNEIAGEFKLSDDDPRACSIEVRVPTASIDSNHPERDKHLKSADFFEVEKYPEIRFTSRSFKKLDKDNWEVVGELSLHGVTKPLTIKLQRTGAGKDPWNNYRTGLETTFIIQRSAFGITTMLGALGDDVQLTVSMEGIRQ
jgi:polyisoprenoid-binding protein YceI